MLDFIRKEHRLYGTKEVCREGDCGACTVLIGELVKGKLKYQSINSCIYPLGNAAGKHIVTIEGLTSNELNFVQANFVEHSASQCGFCTPGFINSFTGYLMNAATINYEDAKNAVAGNICRCTGYASILRAIEASFLYSHNKEYPNKLSELVSNKIIPNYFLEIEERLLNLSQFQFDNISENENVILGGGTDLLVQKENYLQNTSVSLSTKYENIEIYENDSTIFLQGKTTFEEFKNSKIIGKYFPNLFNQLKLIASLPIRNAATVAGNIVNASPIADFTIILLALNAEAVYCFNKITKKIKLRDLYSDYKKLTIPTNSFINEISIKKLNNKSLFNFEKVSKRTYLDIASVNTAISISVTDNNLINDISISAGGIAPIPFYLKRTSDFLLNKKLNADNILESLNYIDSEISPISDIRGSKEYKSLLLKQLIKAHFIELFPEIIDVADLI